ncbi:MAG: pilus assembly protein N-terminal domain-containing protein [Acidobacteria bacterium]|nr:pilus assembly protein N-terminal domain-containing protein [Acidobacteriota bacterium]
MCCLCWVVFAAGSLHAQTPGAFPQASVQDAANDLVLAVGKSVLVDSSRQVERVAIGASDIAEATAVSTSEVMVNGKAPGETTLIVWQAGGGRQFFNVRVHANAGVSGDRLDALRRELRTEFPGQPLRVSAEGGNVFLRGTVKDLESSDRATQIASTAGKVVNLLYVNVPPPEPQILLKVRFASVDRTRGKSLGLNVFSTGAANTIGTVTTQQFSPPSLSSSTSTSGGTGGTGTSATSVFNVTSLLNIFLLRPDINLGATIQALQTDGVLQVLAEPNLLTTNGKQGSFLAGGQYPYPVVQGVTGGGTGAVTIQFKEYGVRLNFIPTITPRGTIRLQVAPEVSALDFVDGVTISGFTVPALTTRKVNTEVELNEGQSFVIGGLLDNRETKSLSKIPYIGDVPILGKLFHSMNVNHTNTELIVLVTPEIVNPIPAGVAAPDVKFPDKFLPANTAAPLSNPAGTAAAQTPAPQTVSVEKLVRSMQPETPLVIDSSYGPSGAVGNAGAASSGPTR